MRDDYYQEIKDLIEAHDAHIKSQVDKFGIDVRDAANDSDERFMIQFLNLFFVSLESIADLFYSAADAVERFTEKISD